MSLSKKIERSREYWDKLSSHNPSCSVLDPKDKLGYKNHYIRISATSALHDALSGIHKDSVILDFGCGTGQNFDLFDSLGFYSIGMDISFKLLQQATKHTDKFPCIQYNGKIFPLADSSVDIVSTFGVLVYLVDDVDLIDCLQEMNRVLKLGGKAIFIEQMTRNDRLDRKKIKRQRNKETYIKFFKETGFSVKSITIIRRGHFPLIYIIRYGLMPKYFFPYILKLENFIGKIIPNPILDYTDIMFILEKTQQDCHR